MVTSCRCTSADFRLLSAGFRALLGAAAIVLGAVSPVRAAQTNVTWDPGSEPTITGYKVHYGLASGSYSSVTDVGLQGALLLAGLEDGRAHYIAVTAYDGYGQESAYSDEVIFIGAGADVDGDGLPGELELAGCTDPNDADTDNDGVPDGVEDASHDGLVDAGETDPCTADTDLDGLQDGTELGYTAAMVGPETDLAVFLPDLDPASLTAPLNPDHDGDGLLEGREDLNRNGLLDLGETDPQVADDPLLFADDFSDGSAEGDPQWLPVSGKWSVNTAKEYVTLAEKSNLSLADEARTLHFAAGSIQVQVKFKNQAGTTFPNADLVFHYQEPNRHRFVRITKAGVSIGQVGEFPGDVAGTKQTKALTLAVGKWHRVRVDIGADALVSVYVNDAVIPALSYDFVEGPQGRLGLQAAQAKTSFDALYVWNETVLQ